MRTHVYIYACVDEYIDKEKKKKIDRRRERARITTRNNCFVRVDSLMEHLCVECVSSFVFVSYEFRCEGSETNMMHNRGKKRERKKRKVTSETVHLIA